MAQGPLGRQLVRPLQRRRIPDLPRRERSALLVHPVRGASATAWRTTSTSGRSTTCWPEPRRPRSQARAIDAARRLLSIDELVKETGAYDTDPAKYVAYRAKMAETIVGLKSLVEKIGVGRAD